MNRRRKRALHLVRMLVTSSFLPELVTNLAVGMLVTSFAAFCFRLMLLMICLKRLVRWNWGRLIFFGLAAQVSLVVGQAGLLILVWRGRRRPTLILSSVLAPP